MSPLTVTSPGAFQDSVLKPLIDRYRQVVAQRYTPCPPGDIARLLAAPPFPVSRKVDGELRYLVIGAGGPQLVAAKGRVATGGDGHPDHVDLPVGTVLAGELHVNSTAGRERVGDVAKALPEGGVGLAFGTFDVVQHESTSWRDTTYAARLDLLCKLVPASGPVHAIAVTTVEGDADVIGPYRDVVERQGAEGIVVRCSDGRALKVKPEVTLDLAILG